MFKFNLIWCFPLLIFGVDAIWQCTNSSAEETKWGKKMADASAKMPSGMMAGNIISFGNFDECIEINESELNIQGKYCLVFVRISNYTPEVESKIIDLKTQKLGVCFPSSCSNNEIETIVGQELEENNSLGPVNVTVDEQFCSLKAENVWTTTDIVTFTFLGIYGLWLLFCTLADSYGSFSEATLAKIQIFSLYTNSKFLFRLTPNTDRKRGNINCLDGLRVLSLLWIILSHRLCLSALMKTNINNFTVLDVMTSFFGLYIYGGTYAVDSFFVLSGTLVSLGFFKMMDKGTNVFTWIYFYVHRFLRISIALIVVLVFILTMFGSLGSGPWWNYLVQLQIKPCQTQWWSVLLQIQNYIYPLGMCYMPSWYLNVDFQLYLLAPLFLYPVAKWRKHALFVIAFYVLLSQAVVMLSVYLGGVSEAGLNPVNPKVKEWNQSYYQTTHARATPWFVGLFVGFYIYKKNKELYYNKFFALVLWVVALGALLGVVLGIYPFVQVDYKFNEATDLFFTSFSRTFWSVGLAWVIVSCHFGYGGPINSFLSLPIWQPFVKISYGMYLFSFLVLIMRLGYLRTNTYFSQFQSTCDSIPDLFLTCVVGVVVFLGIEQPIFILENKFWDYLKRREESGVENQGFELRCIF